MFTSFLIFDLSSNNIFWVQFLIGFNIPITVCFEIWEFHKNIVSHLGGSEVAIVVEEALEQATTDKEVCDGKLFANQECSIGTSLVNEVQELRNMCFKQSFESCFFVFRRTEEYWPIIVKESISCLDDFICLLGFKRIIWVVSKLSTKISQDVEALTHSGAIRKFQAWHLTIWHSWLQSWPSISLNSFILPVNTSMIE